MPFHVKGYVNGFATDGEDGQDIGFEGVADHQEFVRQDIHEFDELAIIGFVLFSDHFYVQKVG